METPESLGLMLMRAVFIARRSAQDNKQPFTVRHAADIVDRLLEGCLLPPETPKKPRKPRTPPVTTTDETWIQGLEQNPVYAGIDIRRELGKAQVWAGERKHGVTRKRFVNWLNKAERPIGYNGVGRTSAPQRPVPQRPVYSVSNPAPGWPLLLRNYLQTDLPEERLDALCAGDWAELPEDIRQKLIKAAS